MNEAMPSTLTTDPSDENSRDNSSTDSAGDGAVSKPERPPPQQQLHDWSAFYDDERRLYYYNLVTEESSWDPPSSGVFNPPDEEEKVEEGSVLVEQQLQEAVASEVGNHADTVTVTDENDNVVNKDHGKTMNNSSNEDDNVIKSRSDVDYEASTQGNRNENVDDEFVKNVSATNNDTTATTDVVQNHTSTECDWSAFYDEEGRIFYYNGKTEESVWEAPAEGFNPPVQDDVNASVHRSTDSDKVAADEGMNDDPIDDGVDVAVTIKVVPELSEAKTNYENEEMVSSIEDNVVLESGHVAAATSTTTTTPWIAYTDGEGSEYYYNDETGESQWDAPDSYRQSADDDEVVDEARQTENKLDQQSNDNITTINASKVDSEIPVDDFSALVDEEDRGDDIMEELIPMVDPAVQRLKDAEDAICSPDAILEPNCMAQVSEIVKADNGNATRAISALIDYYYGQTAVCGLLSRWYLDLCKTNQREQLFLSKSIDRNATNKSSLTNMNSSANHLRNVIQNVINKVAKEKYTKEAGDSILDLSKSEVTFLEDMMDSTRWRQLLIDLSASHKDSAVLLYCLRAISKRGHHREIAQRINISDHFTVFNAMLLSELTIVGQQAISAQSDITTATTFHDLINDIIKACTATSYTYLYSIQMLRKLIQLSTTVLTSFSVSSNDDDIGSSEVRFRRAILKWETLLQLLEASMVDPSNISIQKSTSGASSSPLLRRRQLEVALTISDLTQRQRLYKRQRTMVTSSVTSVYDDDVDTNHTVDIYSYNQNRLESAVIALLKRHSMGIQIDDSVLDKLLPSGLDVETYGVGELLIKYPIAVRSLLGHLYKPGPARITSPSTKNKCARLIALSMLAAEKSVHIQNDFDIKQSAGGTANYANNDIDGACEDKLAKNDITVSQQIVQGSLYCEQLENMIFFLVTTNDSNLTESRRKKSLLTVGEKLCTLALSITPIGLGVAMWAREYTQGKEYATSASYPTLSLSILSLARLVALEHPFARSDVLHVGLAFIRHSNSEVSYQKVNLIKECALRLLIFLLVQGDIVPVLSSLTQRVQQVGSSDLDASLIRYFVGGVLDVVQSPVSPMFMRMFGLFLMSPNVTDAVRSTYFAESNRKTLLALVNNFYASNNFRSLNDSATGKELQSLVSALISTYR